MSSQKLNQSESTNKKEQKSEEVSQNNLQPIEILNKLKSIYKEKNTFELTTDNILEAFTEYLDDENVSEKDYEQRVGSLKTELKKIAFYDRQDKMWILRD